MNINKIKINFKELALNDLGPLQVLEYSVEIQPELKSTLSLMVHDDKQQSGLCVSSPLRVHYSAMYFARPRD